MKARQRRAGGAYRRKKRLTTLHTRTGKDRSKSRKKAKK